MARPARCVQITASEPQEECLRPLPNVICVVGQTDRLKKGECCCRRYLTVPALVEYWWFRPYVSGYLSPQLKPKNLKGRARGDDTKELFERI